MCKGLVYNRFQSRIVVFAHYANNREWNGAHLGSLSTNGSEACPYIGPRKIVSDPQLLRDRFVCYIDK